MNIVFFGSSSYVLPIVEVLRKNFDLKLVLATEHLVQQGEALRTPVIDYCIKHEIPYLSASSSSDLINRSSLIINHSSLGVLADFGLIIPPEILSAFPKGIINIHPSLLPKYRGPTPVQTAILNGEKTTGVSIMKIDEEIDHGPILKQKKVEILSADTSETLYKKLFEMGANLLPKILINYLNGNLKPSAQNHKKATFTKTLTRHDGFIDLSSPKLKIARMVRAYYPWPGVWTRLHLGGGRLSLRSHDSSEVKEKIIKFLPNKKLQVEGKKPISYKDFLNGYPGAPDEIKKLKL